MARLVAVLTAALVVSCGIAYSQETRGSITGKIIDPQGAVIPGAQVVVTNIETNTVSRTVSNETGYFETNLLIPGLYSVTAEAAGFKKTVRSGLTLSVAGRIDVELQMQVGQLAETVEVTAEAPLLDTSTASGGRVIDNRQIMQLPFSDLNPFVLAGLAPGMQWTGQPAYRRPFDNGGTSAFNTAGNVGSNEYTIDGAPNTNGRQVAYVPPSDAVEEFKLETANFDASYGHTSGATINVMTKAGTNDYHGTLYDQHWQQRLNATNHFRRLAWENRVRSGEISEDTPKQAAGRQNYFGGTIGGPVRIPKLYDGRNNLFFFFQYSGIHKNEAETTDAVNRTVPKMAWREGDFSDMLALDAVRYQIYDPRSARREGNTVVRTPFPGNRGIPILNPMYQHYVKLYPTPNDVPGLVSREGFDNYFASAMPKNERFKSLTHRMDYNISDRHRVYGRWYYNRRNGDEYDWTYETARGLQSNGITRINKGIGADYVWTLTSSSILNLGANWGRYTDGASGDLVQTATQYKPSDVGLPAYLDAKAGEFHRLPGLDFNDIDDLEDGYPFLGRRDATSEGKVMLSTIRGDHSIKFGWNERRYVTARGGPGNTSGNFTFRNDFVKASDIENRASNHVLDWASFMMGLPTSIGIDTNDSAYWSSRWRAFYVHDDWRITNRLRLNLGLRYEHEGGIRERFNRGLAGGIDWNGRFPFSDLVEAAYARNPLPEVPASQFKVQGTQSYLGDIHDTWTDGAHHWMPRIGAVYQLNRKTVVRAGYGMFYDIFNPLTDRPSQNGFSQGTGVVLTNDRGMTFCCGIGDAANLSANRTVLHDPFPIRANGLRFEQPFGNSLGVVRMAGAGLDPVRGRDYDPARQQRWRLGVQRELSSNMVFEIGYTGALSRVPLNHRIDYLPQQYWATGMTRQQNVDNYLNETVLNPYYIANLAPLQESNPLAYNYLSGVSFFSQQRVARNRLLRPFNILNNTTGPLPDGYIRGTNRYHDLQLQFERRFSSGFQTSVMYTYAYGKEAEWFASEFDLSPTYRWQNDLRPHRLAWTAIYELPFGKGRRWVNSSPLQHIVGGWQLSWIYQFQNGSTQDWGNRFFYGDIDQLDELFRHSEVHERDIHAWFDRSIVWGGPADPLRRTGNPPPDFVGFEGRSANQPGSYHVRVFPSRLSAIRSDGIRNWDVKILRRFRMAERAAITVAADFLNATNHTNFTAPNVDPTNANFGRVTAQNGLPRVIQFTGRLEF
jgi:hypothetical protein